MRTYPRSFVGPDGVRKRVNNEMEEYELSLKGYERHRNPEINKLQKGTDKEILRVKPEVEDEEIVEPVKVQDETKVLPETEGGVSEAPKKEMTRGQKAWATRKKKMALKAGI